MENETQKPEWSFKVPKPSKRAAKTTLIGVAAASLIAMFYNAKSYSTRERTVTWVGGEQQTDWKPISHEFRNASYQIGITEDGFVVARPVRLPPAPIPVPTPQNPSTNK